MNESSLSVHSAGIDLGSRLERLERLVARLERVAESAPAAVAVAADSLDGWAAALQAKGIDVDARARDLAKLADSLTRPESMRVIFLLVEHADRLERLVTTLDGLPGMVAALADTADGALARIAAAGIDVEERAAVMGRLLDRVSDPEASLDALLDRRTLLALGRVAAAASRAEETTPASVGPWGALRALGDADVQRSLGFLLELARQLGKTFDANGRRLAATSTVGDHESGR